METPEYFSVKRASRSIDINWLYPAQDQSCTIGHEIFRADSPGGPYTLVVKLEKSNGLYRDESAVAGKVYFYKMRAFCGDKYSGYTKDLSRKR